jgi:methylphosphotriester-DNA--protein-cysteine methyltransferase
MANEAYTCETIADEPRWARIVARDRHADGAFWYSVLTTGVYCRPVLPIPHRQSEKRTASCHACRSKGDRFQTVQAV